MSFVSNGSNHVLFFNLSLSILGKVQLRFRYWQQHLRPNSISCSQKKRLSVHFAFIGKSMFGHNRRSSLQQEEHHSVAGVSRQWHRQTCATKPNRLALTPLCSSVIGKDWIVIDLDRSVIGPGSTVTRKASQRESPLKRLHELCETCHSKAVFHYTAVKYLRRFLILALQLDRNAPFWVGCGWRGDRRSCKNSIHKKMETTQM